jgi:plasmid maintenance system antidote protein VapI
MNTRDCILIRREYLVKRQRKLHISNFDAAEKLDISLRQYTRILDGVRGKYLSALLMQKICMVFGFSAEELLKLEADYQSRVMNIKAEK